MASSATDNIIAALRQNNRVYKVDLWDLEDLQLEEVLAAMQVPFPELRILQLFSCLYYETPVIPDSFLDGSAPRLRHFELDGIPFLGLPKLLFSATHLVDLWLDDIPDSVYISPEAMVALLSMLSSLRRLSLGFQSFESGPGRESQSLPSPKRSILPALHKFHFKGVAKYLEELVAHIDTPQLYYMDITFHPTCVFNTPRLVQFINCTPTLRALNEGWVQFYDHFPDVTLRYRTSEFRFDKLLISILCAEPSWRRSSVWLCNSPLHPLSAVKDLYIDLECSNIDWENDAIENTLWLELLLPFTVVKNLYLSKVFAPGIAATLQELVGARITEVLPSLRNIFVEGLEPSGPLQESIGHFVTTRQLSDHPITISVWDKTPA
jgi:hypothetical protein